MGNEHGFITDNYEGELGFVGFVQAQNLEREITAFFSAYPHALELVEGLLKSKLNNAYINKFSYTLNADGIKDYFLEINHHFFDYKETLPEFYKLVGGEEFDDMFFDVVKIQFTISAKDITQIMGVALEFIHRNKVNPDVWQQSTGYKFSQSESIYIWLEDNLSRLNRHVNVALHRYEDRGLKKVLIALNAYCRNKAI